MFVVSLVVALSIAVPSAPKKASWVALVRAPDKPTWRDPLRRAVEDSAKDRTWLAPPAVTLDEAQLALGCPQWNEACAGQIATMSNAKNAIVIDVVTVNTPVGELITITAQSVKANGAADGPKNRAELPGSTPEALAWAVDFVAASMKNKALGWLVVESDAPAAELLIDGEPVGKTPWRGGLEPGGHKLLLRAEGRAPAMKDIVVRTGAVATETLTLGALGPAVTITPIVAETPPIVEAPAVPARDATVGWSLLGTGGAVAAASSVVLGVILVDLFVKPTPCGSVPGLKCYDDALFGLYSGPARADFYGTPDEPERGTYPAWIGGTVTGIGAGLLLVATGASLAFAPDETAPMSAGAR